MVTLTDVTPYDFDLVSILAVTIPAALIGIVLTSLVVRRLGPELADDADREDLKGRVEAALDGTSDVLWITDKRGKDVAIPAAKIAYIELGSADSDRRIGFGG